MNLYGEELLRAGIVLLIISAAAAAVFAVYFVLSGSRLRKKLEDEYGSKNK